MFARSGKPGRGAGSAGRGSAGLVRGTPGHGSAGRGTSGHGSVQSITGAPTSHTDDVRGREKRYLISMGVRTVCFLLAIVVPSPWRWGLVVAAVFLPYVAVVIANAGRDPGRSSPPAYVPERRQLESTTTLPVGPTVDANRAAGRASDHDSGHESARDSGQASGRPDEHDPTPHERTAGARR